MGVYIKGMEMPISCGDCKAFVCYRQWAGDIGDCFCGITKSDAKVGERNADCPLVPVPPHGDLIDRGYAIATACSGRIRALPTTEDGEDWIRVDEVRESIKSAPTIIPASEEGE